MYYKGNNIGLNYDAANGTWSFSNEPQDYIDTNAFSTPDPVFDYTPPPADETDEEDTNCPEGYIYDNTLKQCVPDPSVQNNYNQQQNQGGGNDAPAVRIAGTNKTTTNGNFRASDAEYKAMSPSELIENYKQRKFIKKNDKGELVIDFNRVMQGGGILDSLLGRFSGGGESQASLNKVINYLVDKNILTRNQIYETDGKGGTGNYKFNSEVVIPTIAKFEADYYGIPTSEVLAPGFGDSIYGTKASVQQTDDYMQKKLDAFKVVANNTISNYNKDGYSARLDSLDAYKKEQEKEKARKAKFQADIDKAKAEREMQKTNSQQQEFDNLSNLKQGESYTDDSGDTYTKTTTDNRSGSSGQGFSFTPSKTNTNTKTYENKRKGGYTGSTAGRGGIKSAKTPSRSSASTKANTARTSSRVSSSGTRRAYGL
jgi:hypothetical protein